MTDAPDYSAPIDKRRAKSAAGLFNATGKKRKGGEAPREKDDFNRTPPEPTRALLYAERRYLERHPTIWEPCAGDGAISRELERAGHTVINSDLIDRGAKDCEIRSFYDFTEAPSRAIITNPPYQEINWQDGHARWHRWGWNELDLDYCAMLLSWSWPGAAGHGDHWAINPPSRVYMCRWRIDFTGEKSQPANHGWFVWDRAHPVLDGELPGLGMLDRTMDGASLQEGLTLE